MDEKPYDICERTFEFAIRIIKFCSVLNESPGTGWVLAKQLLRSGTSVGANIEEGQSAQSKADFISKYSIARKEVRETRYWLRLVEASRIATDLDTQPLIDEAEQLYKILTTIIKNTQR